MGGIFAKPAFGSLGKNCAKILPGKISGQYILNGKIASETDIIPYCTKAEDTSEIPSTSAEGRLVIMAEQLVQNHPELSKFHPSSLNTVRIVTLRTPTGGWEYWRACQRFGVGGISVDNVYAGGIAIPVTKDGKLGALGNRKRIADPPYTHHPDSGIEFKDFQIPFWHEAVDLCLKARRECFPEAFNIGFDVAITPTGPVIIEANLGTGILQQEGCGGARVVMETWLEPLVKKFLRGETIEY